MSQKIVVTLCIALTVVLSCADRGPSLQEVEGQVRSCLASIDPQWSRKNFLDVFDIQGVEIQDRMIEGKRADLIVKLNLKAIQGFNENMVFMDFRHVVAKPKEEGEVFSEFLKLTFVKYEGGWRTDCKQR